MVDGDTPITSASRDGVEHCVGGVQGQFRQHAPVAAVQLELGQLLAVVVVQPLADPAQCGDHPLDVGVGAGRGVAGYRSLVIGQAG